MEDLEKYILSKEDCAVSSDQLKAYGRRATSRYLEDKVPLNDSIRDMAKEANLNHEQVKRVVEFANNDTFVSIFKSGFGENITFPMADSNAVMQGMHEPAMAKVASLEVVRNKYVAGQESVSLDKAFGYKGGMEKVASVDRSKVKLAYLSDKNRLDDYKATKELLGTAFELKLGELTTLCKQAAADGYSPEVIGAAVEKASPSRGLLSVISGVMPDTIEVGHLAKIAMGGYMVPENPITGLTQDLESISQKLIATQQSVQKTQASMTELLSVLKGPEMSPSPGAQLFQQSAPAPMPGQPMQGQPPSPMTEQPMPAQPQPMPGQPQ